VTTHPRAADGYVLRFREFLVAENPSLAKQLLVCERTRISRALGSLESSRRIADAEDSIVRSAAARAALERADAATARGMFQVAGTLCDSLNAIADREEGPILQAPDSLRVR